MVDPAECIIEDNEQLHAVCQKFRDVGIFGFDTEFIREYSYFPQLCLVQAGTEDFYVLIDPFRVEMEEFWQLVIDPGVKKIVHAGQQDLEICHLVTGRPPANIVDVQIAAGLAGFPYPLSYAKLIQRVLGKSITLAEAFSDWSRRPLTERQLAYAATDVVHLVAAEKKLQARLKKLGRTAWLEEEMRPLQKTEQYIPSPTELWKRVRGVDRLSRRKLAILSALAQWRDLAACQTDTPPRTFLRDETLTAIARSQPGSLEQLRAVRGFPRPLAKQYGQDVLEAIRAGEDVPESELPTPTAPKEGDAADKMLLDFASAIGQALCGRKKLDHRLFASRSNYVELINAVRSESPEHDSAFLMTGWRKEFAGEQLWKVLTGRRTVRLVNMPANPSLQIE